MTISDNFIASYAQQKGSDKDREANLALAVGILLGGNWPGCAAAVTLAWQDSLPLSPLPTLVEELAKRGQQAHEDSFKIPEQTELTEEEQEVMRDYFATHPGVSREPTPFDPGSVDLDDEIPF